MFTLTWSDEEKLMVTACDGEIVESDEEEVDSEENNVESDSDEEPEEVE